MNRSRARHRLRRSSHPALRLRPNDRTVRRGPVHAVRALLAGAVGLLLLTGTALGVAHVAQADVPVPAAYVSDR
ncbi:MAG: hypothetical protein ABS81_29835 [Pseudonocardia sp. SCN 72-86]|nr:MAG: hypothetical protein ABS81_29835 [Pseudonocardia sp. SCN 72-86]